MPIHDTYTKSFAQDANRGVTVATINLEGETFTGSAKTAPKELFRPEIGRLLAEARALDSISSKLKHEANNLAGEKLTD